ncbi:MAG: class I SAM-dependent methyltransferase [Pseudomonadota bacterium]
MPQATTYRACPACGADQAEGLESYSPDPWHIVTCSPCGFVYLQNPPEYEALKEDFAFEKTAQKRRKTRQKKSWTSRANRKLRRALKTDGHRWGGDAYLKWFGPGKVLDVGCGHGQALPPPITPFGIELSTELHRHADAHMRTRGGYCVQAPGADGIWDFEPDFFDGVLMNSYLEHETQVGRTLEGAHRALKPGGKLFIRVPNFGSLNRKLQGAKWCGFRWPDHVNYFTLQSLTDIAGRLGFSANLINKMTLPVDDNVQVLLTKKAPVC